VTSASATRRIVPLSKYAFLTIFGLLMLGPLLFALYTSLESPADYMHLVGFSKLTLSNYRYVIDNAQILRWYFNTAFVTAGVVIGAVVVNTMAGYALARIRFPGRTVAFVIVLAVLMVPLQAILIPIADRHLEFTRRVEQRMKQAGLRVEVDPRAERMNAKIRDAQLQKIPFMLIAGDREVQADSVAVRLRSGEDLGPLKVEGVIARLREAIQKGD